MDAVNNGCLMHLSLAEQVDFLFFPLFWFQPPSGMFSPGTFLKRGFKISMVSEFFFGPDVLNGCVTQRKWPYKRSWSRQSVYKRHLSKKTSEVQDHRLVTHKIVCMCLSVSVCTAECVCWWYSPGGGPWSALTRAIKVYKHEAHLSIMLTGCPHPTPLVSEPQETPTNPDPAQRAGLGHSW